jgi:hypothetical protein
MKEIQRWAGRAGTLVAIVFLAACSPRTQADAVPATDHPAAREPVQAAPPRDRGEPARRPWLDEFEPELETPRFREPRQPPDSRPNRAPQTWVA